MHTYGIHAVMAILKNKPDIIQKLWLQKDRQDARFQEIKALAQQQGKVIQLVSKAELDKLATDHVHQGVIAAIHETPNYTEADLQNLLQNSKQPPLLLILDGVQDPHNVGACLRTANAAGVTAVIVPKDNAAGITAVTRKVASGAAETTPLIQVTNLARTMRFLKEQGIWLYGTSDDAKESLYQTSLTGALGLVMGAEGQGMRRLTQEQCDGMMHIPMLGQVSSLNVSVATGICLFETLRQRQQKK